MKVSEAPPTRCVGVNSPPRQFACKASGSRLPSGRADGSRGMLESEFGPNGVKLSGLDDYQLYRENRFKDHEICLPVLLGMAAALACLTWTIEPLPAGSFKTALEVAAFSVVAILIVGGCLGFRDLALEQRFIRRSRDADRFAPHITGIGAAIALGLVCFVGVAAFFGQRNFGEFTIPESVGLGAIGLLGAGFLLFSLTPFFLDLDFAERAAGWVRWLTVPLRPVGNILSGIDIGLVHLIAPLAGATLRNWYSRYAILLGHIGTGTTFAWFASPPLGFAGILWALACSFSIARRWAWIENERQRRLKAAGREVEDRRISIAEDLRDEAVWGLILLVVVLPIGMRQFSMLPGASEAFLVRGGVENDPFAWMGFFGVELLKALPFIDWADIYGARGDTRISTDSALAMHAVFAARVIIDLVFLATLLQAVSVSVALSRHKNRFLSGDPEITVLDDRIERGEIARLAKRRNGNWEYRSEIEKYARYDSTRLSRLRLRCKEGTRLQAALIEIFRIAKLEFEPPGEQLVDIARDLRPDQRALGSALDLVRQEGHYDLAYLAEARRLLNWKRDLEPHRLAIVQLIVSQVPVSNARTETIREMAMGSHADSLSNNRILALDALLRSGNVSTLRADLETLALDDRSSLVRRRAIHHLRERYGEQAVHALKKGSRDSTRESDAS